MKLACRGCGDVVRGEPTPLVLEWLGVSVLPEWLSALCLDCLYEVANKNPWEDGDALPPRSVTPEDLNAFLVEKLGVLARRVANNLSVDRCEIERGGQHIGDPEDMRCRHFSAREWQGRPVCSHCFHRAARGQELRFINDPSPRPRLFVIWARTRTEFEQRVQQELSSQPLPQ